MKNEWTKNRKFIFTFLTTPLWVVGWIAGCSSVKSVLAIDQDKERLPPISNPFGDFYKNPSHEESKNMIFRTKRGDRSVEVEIPSQDQDISDFTVPISPAFRDVQGRSPASPYLDDSYAGKKPTYSDREISSNMSHGTLDDTNTRSKIERGLGLVQSDPDGTLSQDPSYLAGVDRIKQLYKLGRYEAAMIELDHLLVHYQTDSKLYEMRGTLYDRLGRNDLAMKSWNQSLRFDPNNKKLKKYIDRKQKIMGGVP